MTDDPIGKGAAAISDLLTMLGVDPDERPEHGGPSTAATVAATVLQATGLVVSVDTPAIKQAIAEAVARGFNQAAGSIWRIRVWCDAAAAMHCSHTTEAECRRCEAIKDCALAVRSLLPPVPPARGEDGVNDDRDL